MLLLLAAGASLAASTASSASTASAAFVASAASAASLSTICRSIAIPTLQGSTRSALTCYPSGGGTYPLHVFAHGNGGGSVMIYGYTSLLKELASFGFVVAAYKSCPIDSHCPPNGESQFLEAIKTIRFFEEHPAAAPVDFSQRYSASGHSTGARAVLMLAAARDNPSYLNGSTASIRLTASDRKIMEKVACVIGDHTDPMADAKQDPDIPRFRVTRTPTMLITGTLDVRPIGEPANSSWVDFRMLDAPPLPANPAKVFLNIQGASHLQPVLGHPAVPYLAAFAQFHALGNVTAGAMIYGDGPGSLLALSRRANDNNNEPKQRRQQQQQHQQQQHQQHQHQQHQQLQREGSRTRPVGHPGGQAHAAPFEVAGPGESNDIAGLVGFLACGGANGAGAAVPGEYARYCRQPEEQQPQQHQSPLPLQQPQPMAASLRTNLTRPLVKYGAGNELCWQSLFDPGLVAAARALGGGIGRFPGGTPSDYWDWQTGWASDVAPSPVRPATPAGWRSWARAVALDDSILVMNQLTRNLSYGLAGLRAHEAAGTPVRYVELGNEMYDASRPDVLQAYPTPADYATKMANWTAAVKAAFPAAQVALIGVRAQTDHQPREIGWNQQVLQNPVSHQADAATLHIYCGGMPGSHQAPPAPAGFGALLGGAFGYVGRNRAMVRESVPRRLRLWVTELGVYPAGPLDGTWLQALYNAVLLLELPGIGQVDVVAPYCLVCQDPTGPSLTTAQGPVVDPGHNASHAWYATPKGIVEAAIFSTLRRRRAPPEGASAILVEENATMTPFEFASNPVLDPSTPSSVALLGWWNDGGRAGVIVNLGAAALQVALPTTEICPGRRRRRARGGKTTLSLGLTCSTLAPKGGAADVTKQGLKRADLAAETSACSGDGGGGSGVVINLPPWGIATVACA